jgi:hypothetical protein
VNGTHGKPPRGAAPPDQQEAPQGPRLAQASKAGPRQGQQQRRRALDPPMCALDNDLATVSYALTRSWSASRDQTGPSTVGAATPAQRPFPAAQTPNPGSRTPAADGLPASPEAQAVPTGRTATPPRQSLTRSWSTSHRRSQRPGGGGAVVIACTNHEVKHGRLCSRSRAVPCEVVVPIRLSGPAALNQRRTPSSPLNLWPGAGQGQSRQRPSRGTSRQCGFPGERSGGGKRPPGWYGPWDCS